MKVLSQILSIGLLFALLTSCEKEVIPEPNDNVSVTTSHALFVSGIFDGVEETRIIDGTNHVGYSYLINDPQGVIAKWGFDVFNPNDSLGFPGLSFRIINHEQSTQCDYQDLVQSTSSSTIDFLSDQQPLETQFGHIVALYFPNEFDFYASDISPVNNPLTVLDAKDTIVDGLQYRILELSGTINMVHPGSLDEITIDNFHARMAFGL